MAGNAALWRLESLRWILARQKTHGSLCDGGSNSIFYKYIRQTQAKIGEKPCCVKTGEFKMDRCKIEDTWLCSIFSNISGK